MAGKRSGVRACAISRRIPTACPSADHDVEGGTAVSSGEFNQTVLWVPGCSRTRCRHAAIPRWGRSFNPTALPGVEVGGPLPDALLKVFWTDAAVALFNSPAAHQRARERLVAL